MSESNATVATGTGDYVGDQVLAVRVHSGQTLAALDQLREILAEATQPGSGGAS